MREIASGAGRTFDDIDSVRARLSRHDQCTGKIGVTGFCMGGAYAVALAPGHGFINNPDPADATPLLIFLAKISGTRYHEASAQDALRRIAAFFRMHLED